MKLEPMALPGGPRNVDPHTWWTPLVGALAIASIVLYGMSSGVRSEVVIILYVYALLGAGLYVPLVLTDQVSLAYGAYFGVGAYTFAVVSARALFDPVLAIPLGMFIAAGLAGAVAIAMSRLSGYFLAVATMLLAFVFSRVLLEATDLTGGPTGLAFEPTLLGMRVSRLELLIAAGVLVWIVMVGVNNLRASRLGNALTLMSHSAAGAESTGIDTRWARIASLCVGAAIASLAGSVYALSQAFVLPESFGLEIAFLILFMPIIGGINSPWGCLIGATLVALMLLIAPDFGPSRLLFGLLVLGFVLVFPGGILAGIATALERVRNLVRPIAGSSFAENDDARPLAQDAVYAAPPYREPGMAAAPREVLRVEGVGKRFGGIEALRSVSFALHDGEVLGIVGPNGAGKSTLIDVITGVQVPDTGRVVLDGQALRVSAAERARLGMARTFQHPLLGPSLTIRDNVELGLMRGAGTPAGPPMFGWFASSMVRRGKASSDVGSANAAKGAQSLLARDWLMRASDVSYATEKIAEIARALISQPRVLLMDEPFAGLDKSSAQSIWSMLKTSQSDRLATIIVDHNVDLLRDICDRIVVMDQGAVLGEGPPAEVLQRAEVRKAYFGDRDD
jgi:ABC-type branched-subunit amino acid transport system ATPase component/ABC-type branched-subunit amino acid transport system permease subunit